MLYVTFAYGPDSGMLCLLRDRLRELDAAAELYVVSDPKNPVRPEDVTGVHHRTGTVDRGGNLNGLPIIAEELATFASLLEQTGENNIVKIDADCYPIKLDALRDSCRDFVACERWQPFTPAGMVYRLSRHAVRYLQDEFTRRTEAGLWPEGHLWPEDVTLWNLAALRRLRLDLLPYAGNYAAGMVDHAPGELPEKLLQAHFVHCGEPTATGARVTRWHAELRMRCLAEAVKNR